MDNLEKLNNKGVQYIGNKEILSKQQKTIIVVGIGRGGTSLLSGSLHHLGVFTGEKSYAPVFEDLSLANAFEKQEYNLAKEIITKYNDVHNTWAFKRPSINYLNKLNEECLNPIYLIVFKDIFSVANRNSISMKADVLKNINEAQNQYNYILQFINDNNINGFLFSYEKIMAYKHFFIDTLVNLIGKDNVNEKQKNAALQFIEPNPKAYLNVSRITRSIGQIGSIQETRILGWGKYISSNNSAVIELYINDKLIKTTIAKDFRQHLLDSKTHPTGHSGYMFDLSDFPLRNGDKVSVKLEDDVLFLKGSDMVFKLN